MKLKVYGQEKNFYLAANGWVPVAGHEFSIGKHSFCATPVGDTFGCTIIVSEIRSGAKIGAIYLNFLELIVMDDKTKYLEFLEFELRRFVDLLSKREDLDGEILKMEQLATEQFGPKPPTEVIDIYEKSDGVTE